MSEEDQRHLFEPLSEGRFGKGLGAGSGARVVRGAADRASAGGYIDVESAPLSGSTFGAHLPAATIHASKISSRLWR